MVLIGLWLLTQLSPETILFGAGDLRHLLNIVPVLPYAAPSFVALETGIIVCNTIAIGLVVRSLGVHKSTYLTLIVFYTGPGDSHTGSGGAGQSAERLCLVDPGCFARLVGRRLVAACSGAAPCALAHCAGCRTGADGRDGIGQSDAAQPLFGGSAGRLATGALSEFQRADTAGCQPVAFFCTTLSELARAALMRRSAY